MKGSKVTMGNSEKRKLWCGLLTLLRYANCCNSAPCGTPAQALFQSLLWVHLQRDNDSGWWWGTLVPLILSIRPPEIE